MFFFEEIGKEETEGGERSIKKHTTTLNELWHAICLTLKILIKIVSRLSQLSVKQSTLKPNN